MDNVEFIKVSVRFVVGIGREIDFLSLNQEQYLERVLSFIRNSDLSDPLKSQVLLQVDYVDYKGLSVIRIRVPRQTKISFLGDKVFVRENSSTTEAKGKKLLAVNDLFL